MRKLTLTILLLICCSYAVFSQQYKFFGGDSLNGFDYDATWHEIATKGIGSADIPGYFGNKQFEFVSKKYNLHPFPALQQGASFKNNIGYAPSLQASCTNFGFENGNLSGWTGITGRNYNSNNALSSLSTGFSPGPNGAINQSPNNCNRHTLVSGTTLGNDACGGFSTLSPLSGNNAVLLNNKCFPFFAFPSYGYGTSLEQTFSVSQSNALLTIAYAVVLEDGGHSNSEQPYFRAEVLDAQGNAIGCLTYKIIAQNGSTPGFLQGTCQANSGGTVYYKPWTIASFNLAAYMGQNVTIRFTVASCTLAGHFGYAYVDAECGPLAMPTSSAAVCGSNNVVISAPAGATSYAWSVVGNSGNIVGSTTNQNITVNQGGHYQVTITPPTGASCSYTIDTIIPGIPIVPVANFSGTSVCLGSVAQFTDLSTPTGSVTAWNWDFDNNGTVDDTNQNPTYSYTTPGTKQVKLTVEIGPCTKDTVLTFQVGAATPIAVSNTGPYCAGQSIQLDVNQTGGTYQWEGPMGFSTTLQNPVISNSTVNMAGVYSVTFTSSLGCVTTASTSISILPSPTADFIADPQETQILNPIVNFTNLSSDTTQNFVWFFGDGISSTTVHPQHSYENPGEYIAKIVLTNELGCKDSLEKVIRINADALIFVPNSFSPNGDGLNDEFAVSVWGITTYQLKIFNRWGELMFETNDPLKNWNGKDANGKLFQIDTYIWKIEITDLYNQQVERVGHVNMIR
ncbi:MAG: gliding motility-associated C-terminal domain-containing protein [Bacteroidetes bacterium]|nr:gliding motility-associated C-terminal domain-containing protein [Bacteroidota bacterium]